MHFACAFHPGHECWSMVSSNCSRTKSHVNLKRKKSLKRKRFKTIWFACGIKIFSCCCFFVCLRKPKKTKTKTKRLLFPWALTIDLAGKVIGNPKQKRKKSRSPSLREQFLFCYRHAVIPATSINDCNVADSFYVWKCDGKSTQMKYGKREGNITSL